MKKILILTFIVTSLMFRSNAQDEFEVWYKLSPEIRLNFEKSPWEFRWRPDDHIIFPQYFKEFLPSGRNHIARTDIMIGYNIPHFKIFSYSKFDDLGRIFTGARLDFNTSLFNKKLLINIQERLFFNLRDPNLDEGEEKLNHYYLIQFIRYKVAKKIQAGILSYGKFEFAWPLKEGQEKIPFKDNHWFMGPTANFVLPANFNLHVAFTKSIFSENTYMTFVRLGYRIKIKSKEAKTE